jgi:hypothetical protein
MGDLVVIFMSLIAMTLIIGVSVNGIVEKVMREKRLRHEAMNAPGGKEVRELAERTDHIEDRLRVLERIATDKGSLLAEEIEALRLDMHDRRHKENG